MQKWRITGPLLLHIALALMARAQFGGVDPLDTERVKSRTAELTPPDKTLPESEGALLEKSFSRMTWT